MNKVKKLLDKSGLTQSGLMRKTGLAMGTIGQAVNEPDWPTDGVNWGTVRKIAEALGVNPRDLLSNNGTE